MIEPAMADDVSIGVTNDFARIGFAFRVDRKETRLTAPIAKAGDLVMSLLAIAVDPRAASTRTGQQAPVEPVRATLALPVERRTVGRGAFAEAVTISFRVPGNMELSFQLPADDAEALAQAISATARQVRDQACRPIQ